MRGSSKARGNQASPKDQAVGGPAIARATAASRHLTAREREVLELVGGGLEDGAIANELGVAQSSVSTLLRSAIAKLDTRTRTQAVARLAESDDQERGTGAQSASTSS